MSTVAMDPFYWDGNQLLICPAVCLVVMGCFCWRVEAWLCFCTVIYHHLLYISSLSLLVVVLLIGATGRRFFYALDITLVFDFCRRSPSLFIHADSHVMLTQLVMRDSSRA